MTPGFDGKVIIVTGGVCVNAVAPGLTRSESLLVMAARTCIEGIGAGLRRFFSISMTSNPKVVGVPADGSFHGNMTGESS